MKSVFSNKYFLLIARVILGFVFIYAGAEKISNPESFANSISAYKLLPIWMINFLAITLPWIELVSGLLLVFGVQVKENSFIILVLLIVINVAITISLFRGLNIECGCFGNGTQIGIVKLAENILLIILSLILIIYNSSFFIIGSTDKK